MGYSMEDSLLALRICDNNLENACTFLLSNPNPSENMPPSMRPRAEPIAIAGGGSRPAGEQQVSVGYATQLAAQTQQRTQALF